MPWINHLWLSSQARQADFSALVSCYSEGTPEETWLMVTSSQPRGIVIGTDFVSAREYVLDLAHKAIAKKREKG